MTKTDLASPVKNSEVRSYASPGDKFGHTLHLTWLATAGEISIRSMQGQLDITERTARNYVKNYRSSGDSVVLLDRRRFNSGQKRAYRIEPHRGRLLEYWIMQLLEGQSVSSRQLEALLEKAVSDRTIDRFLVQSGLRQAQESGIAQRIRHYFLQERQQAYWAGVASQPLADLDLQVHPNPKTTTSAYIPQATPIDPPSAVADSICTASVSRERPSSDRSYINSCKNWPSYCCMPTSHQAQYQSSQINFLGLAELLSLPQVLITLLLAAVDISLLLQLVSLPNKTPLDLTPSVQQASIRQLPAAFDLAPAMQQAIVPLWPAVIDLVPAVTDLVPSIQQAIVPSWPTVIDLVPELMHLAQSRQQAIVPLWPAVIDLVPMQQAIVPWLPIDTRSIAQTIVPSASPVDLTRSVQELPTQPALLQQVPTQIGVLDNSYPQPASLIPSLSQPSIKENRAPEPACAPAVSKTVEQVKSSIAYDEWQKPKVGQTGLALGLAHLSSNGVFKSLEKLLPEERSGYLPSWLLTTGLLLYLLASGGQRLSAAKHFVWGKVSGLLVGCNGLSASTLRNWLLTLEICAKESVTVPREDGKSETINRLRDYQEESIAQRHKAGIINGEKIYLDDYVNALFRSEPIARAKHGTSAHIVKAFRRHVCQDIETGLPVTCPLSRSNCTSSHVLEKIVNLINGGLDRVKSSPLKMVVADRWWSNEPAIRMAQKLSVGLLTWTKNDASVKNALSEVSDTEWLKSDDNQEADQESTVISRQPSDLGSQKEPETTYYLDRQIMIYKLSQPVRVIAHWNGKAEGKKLAALAIGLESEKHKTSQLLNYLPFRQRVEILIKGLQRRVQLANFGGGKAIIRKEERSEPLESDQKRWQKNKKQVQTRQKKAEVRLGEVEKEIKHLESHAKAEPRNSLALGKSELKQLARSLRNKLSRYTKRLAELSGLLAWASGEADEPAKEEIAELDLTREALLAQMKLDIFTAQETLVNEFIDIGLKPVLLREAQAQADARKKLAKCSEAKRNKGQLLTTDVEELLMRKVANLERETILLRLISQPGEFLLHEEKRLILSVFQRFSDKRTQSAFEHYCPFLNQKGIQIRLDDGPPWRLLFTYHSESVR